MKSPITGGPARFVKKEITSKFRGEEFPCMACEWQCEDTNETMDLYWGKNFVSLQVYVQYALKHHQPLPYQIKRFRHRTNISYETLSTLSGIPEKDIKAYVMGETEAMPAEYDYSYLHALCSASSEHYADFLCKTKGVEFLKWPLRNFYVSNKIDKSSKKFREGDVYHYYEEGLKTGFGEKCEAKLDAALVYIVKSSVEPLSQKDLEDILFFSDLISYVRNGVSVSGLPYVWENGIRCEIPFICNLLPTDIMSIKEGDVHLLVDLHWPNLDPIFADAIELSMQMPEEIKAEVREMFKDKHKVSFNDAITEKLFVFARENSVV